MSENNTQQHVVVSLTGEVLAHISHEGIHDLDLQRYTLDLNALHELVRASYLMDPGEEDAIDEGGHVIDLPLMVEITMWLPSWWQEAFAEAQQKMDALKPEWEAIPKDPEGEVWDAEDDRNWDAVNKKIADVEDNFAEEAEKLFGR